MREHISFRLTKRVKYVPSPKVEAGVRICILTLKLGETIRSLDKSVKRLQYIISTREEEGTDTARLNDLLSLAISLSEKISQQVEMTSRLRDEIAGDVLK